MVATMRIPLAAVLVWSAIGSPPVAQNAPAVKSGALATELASLMGPRKVYCVATRDPLDPAILIAAMSFDGSLLNVVTGKYPGPGVPDAQIDGNKCPEVFSNLVVEAVSTSKMVVMDNSSDGLKSGDAVTLEKDDFLLFDGTRFERSVEEYDKAVLAAHDRYARLLELLLAAVKRIRGPVIS